MKTSKFNNIAPPKPKYPYLGQYTKGFDFIVLFTGVGEGTVVHVEKIHGCVRYLGEWSSCWSEELFVPYNGTVTLAND